MTFFDFKEKVARKIVQYFPAWLSPMQITNLRIVLVVPLIILLLNDHRIWTTLLFVFMALLDFFDGPLARLRNQVTTTGKLLDPFADKVMVLPVFYILGMAAMPAWLVYATIALEILLVTLVFLLKPFFEKIGQQRKLGANKFGKYKMTLQTIGVLWLLILPFNNTNNTVAEYIFYLALIFSALSIIKHMMPERRIDSRT